MLRLGCCCYICKRWFFVDSQEGLLSSRGGGARHTGTRLTVTCHTSKDADYNSNAETKLASTEKQSIVS